MVIGESKKYKIPPTTSGDVERMIQVAFGEVTVYKLRNTNELKKILIEVQNHSNKIWKKNHFKLK